MPINPNQRTLLPNMKISLSGFIRLHHFHIIHQLRMAYVSVDSTLVWEPISWTT